MEFDLRNVLIIIGFVVIAGILFDGYRRMRRSRMGEIGLSSEMGGSCEEGAYYNGELPNGGSRQPGADGGDTQQRIEPEFGGALDGSEADGHSGVRAAKADKEPAIDDSQLGVVGTNVGSFDDDGIGGVRRYSLGGADDADDLNGPQDDEQRYAPVNESQNVLFEDDEMLLSTRAAQEEKLASHCSDNDDVQRRSSKPSKKVRKEEPIAQASQEEDMPLNVDGLEEVIVLNLMARSGEVFGGVELDKALTSCGIRFGDMNIYHRFEQHVGRGSLLFSLANVVEPGFFDPDNLDSFSTPGVCMFMKLPGPKRSMHSFELMVECGRKIVSLLDGELKDEHHCVMTQQTIEHYRQRVLDFDRKFLSQRVTQRS
jgi:cell division protein ZipA